MRTAATRVIAGRVNADGTIATPGGFVAQRTALGVYSLTFPGARLVGASVSTAATYGFVAVDTFTANSFRVVIANQGATATIDQPFTFTATVLT